MNFRFLLAVVLTLAFLVPAYAALSDGLVAYWSFDDNVSEITGNFTSTDYGTTINVSGKLGNARSFDGGNDFVNINTQALFNISQSWSIGLWINTTSTAADSFFSWYDFASGNKGFDFGIGRTASGASINNGRIFGGIGNAYFWATDLSPAANNGNWRYIVLTYDSSDTKFRLYSAGSLVNTSGAIASISEPTGKNFTIGARTYTASYDSFYAGLLDEIGVWNKALNSSEVSQLYNSGTGLNYSSIIAGGGTPASVTFDNYTTPSSFTKDFNTTVSIGASYGTVASTNATFDSSAYGYFGASINTNASVGAGTAQCRINVNGAYYNSTQTRTLTSGNVGNIYLQTSNVSLSGATNISVQCQKTSGSNYDVISTTLVGVHYYDDSISLPVTFNYTEATTTYTFNSSYYNFFNTTITTNASKLNTNNISIVVDWRASPTYTSNGNITLYVNISNNVSALYNRYGASGSTGSVGGVFLLENVSNATTYPVMFYGKGSGGLTDLSVHVYEVDTEQYSTGYTAGTSPLTSGYTEIDSITLNNTIGGSYNTLVIAGVNLYNTNASNTLSSFYLTDGTTTSQIFRRTINGGTEEGNLKFMHTFSESGTSNVTYSLYGKCENNNCQVGGYDLAAFVTDAEATSNKLFNITAYSFYNKSQIQTFSASVGGATYTTTNGTITAVGDGTETIIVNASYHFSNTTSHDTTTNLNASLTTYTWIRAYSLGTGIQLLTFSLNYSSYTNSSDYGTAATQTGSVYLPLYSDSYNVTIYDANGGNSSQLRTVNDTTALSSKNTTFITHATDYISNFALTNLSAYLDNDDGSEILYVRVNVTFSDGTSTLTNEVNQTPSTEGVKYMSYASMAGKPVSKIEWQLKYSTGVFGSPVQVDYRTYIYNETSGLNYASSSANLTANLYLQAYNFSLYTTNSITFNFLDETTGSLILVNVSADLTSSTSSTNISTTNGTYYIDLLTPETYTISYRGDGYQPRTYIYTLSNQSTTTLNLYLLSNSTGSVVKVTVLDQDLTVLPSAYVIVQKKNLTGTNYYTVDMCETDINGECLIVLDISTTTYKSSTVYSFIIQYAGDVVGRSGDTQPSSNTLQLIANLQSNYLQTFFAIPQIQYGLSTTPSTGTFTYTLSDTNGNVQQGCLYISGRSGSQWTSINSSCTASSSFTIILSGNNTLYDELNGKASIFIDDNEYLMSTASISKQNTQYTDLGEIMFIISIVLFGVITLRFISLSGSLTLIVIGGVTFILSRIGLIGLTTAVVMSLIVFLFIIIAKARGQNE